MKVYNLPEIGLFFRCPDDWIVEQEKYIVSIFDPVKGVGALQFSCYNIGSQQEVALKDELADFIKDKHDRYEINVIGNCSFTNYIEGKNDRQWKYWLFLKSNILTFTSYSCHRDDVGKEDKIINNIVFSAM